MAVKDMFGKLFRDPQFEDDNVTETGEEEEMFLSETPQKRSEKAGRGDKNDKIVNISATTQLQVVLVKPERFEDATAVADHLIDRKTVVLNLESTNKDVARRLIDFLTGAAYANNGQLKRVANSTFIITPYNVNLMGDIIDELENNGVYF